MGISKPKTCNVCFKTMRGDNLGRHMKRHERKNENNVVTNGQGTTLGIVKSVDFEEIEKTILSEMKEFGKKDRVRENCEDSSK